METQAQKTQENPSKALANVFPEKTDGPGLTSQFVDNRGESTAQRRLSKIIDNSPQVRNQKTLQKSINNTLQRKTNNMGFPYNPTSEAIQRLVVQQNTIDGLTANLDTTNLDTAKGLINTLNDSGKRKSLSDLYVQIKEADKAEDTANNKKLIKFIYAIIQGKTSSVDENKTSGFGEKTALKFKYWGATATNVVVQAGLRMWITGDPQRGVNWNMIGKHLRGLLTGDEYEQIGTMVYLLEDQQNNTNLVDTFLRAQKIQKAKQLLDTVRNDIRGALDALPDHDGMSYRQAGVANASVFGGTVNVGDYIRDTTFWSTSALRISGSAGNWGDDGTKDAPKVYFIINGSTGKYISKYAGQEEGQHEVLFKNLATFQLTKIANFRNETFFVYLTEVDPTTLAQGQAIKNPYHGATY